MVTSGSHAWIKRLLMLATVFVMLASAIPVQARPGGPGDTASPKSKHPPVARQAGRHDTSKALRSVKVKDHAKPKATRELRSNKLPRVQKPGAGKPGSGGNTVAKPGKGKTPASATAPAGGGAKAPTPGTPITDFIVNFEGTGNNDGVLPPDTNGDVGPNNYVQWVNLSMTVFDRDGNILMGPQPGNTLWQGFGGPCENQNDGDPIVQYDHMANQWMVSQFALFANDGNHQCIAVSKTGDPTGEWHRYDFLISATKFNDYPHFGVWPDAYYMSINQFDQNFNYAGAGAVAFERDKMLAGEPAQMVYFDVDGGNQAFGGMLPSDLDSDLLPPAGAPNLFAEQDDDAFGAVATDRLSFWAFHVDWAHPENSTFGLDGKPNFSKDTEPYDTNLCGFDRGCIPQPDTTQGLDAISDRLMYRLQYRNFGDHETLVANHTVDADGNDHAGIRWYELHGDGSGSATSGAWDIYQQGTYAPDAASRWMGSAALDASGNLALGFSVSSDSVFPSIRIATRNATDPLGTLPQDELEMMTGTGSQTHPAARWGDYSSMSVDPDQCTLWYTTEYLTQTSSADWHTRVGAFKLPTCAVGPHGTIEGTVTKSPGGDPLKGARVRAGSASTFTDAAGHYKFVLPVETYDLTASAYGFGTQTASGLVVTDGGTITQDFALVGLPTVAVSGTVRDGSGHGYPLYARIDVGGAPIGPIYTDPLTGHYAVTLFQSTPYTFKVASKVPGYQVAISDQNFGAATSTLNFNLLIDGQTCSAPGYQALVGGMYETFLVPARPAGWLNLDNSLSGGQGTWRFDDPAGRGNLTGGGGNFAIIDSDWLGPDGHQDTELWTRNVDLSAIDEPSVQFHTDFFAFPGNDKDIGPEVADVDLSINGGSDWTTIWHETSSKRGPRLVTIPVPTAANQSHVRVRFHYYNANFEFWWQVDDVLVGTRDCNPTPGGGLLVGQVTDANTTDPIDRATVASVDEPADTTTSFATPDDPAQGDGMYILYSSLTGSHPFTAAKKDYMDDTDNVDVAPATTTAHDFSLGAGRLSATPNPLAITLPMGGTADLALTLGNAGAAAVAFEIRERDGGREILAPKGAPLRTKSGTFSPHSATSRDFPTRGHRKVVRPSNTPPWIDVADYPIGIEANAADSLDGKVYSVGGFSFDTGGFVADGAVYDPGANAWSPIASLAVGREKPAGAFVGDLFYVVGGWAGDNAEPSPVLEIYDPASNTWSTGAESPAPYAAASAVSFDGKLYFIGGCNAFSCGTDTVTVYDPASNEWSFAAPYPEQTSWASCGAIDALIYCAGGVSDQSGDLSSAYVYDPAGDAWSPIASLPTTMWGSGFVAANGLLLVSGGIGGFDITNIGFAYDPGTDSWSSLPNSNNSVFRGGSACGFYRIGGIDQNFNFVPSVEILPGFDECGGGGDVPWLSEDPVEGTVPALGNTPVTVHFDAGVEGIDQPGDYRAQLTFKEDTPYKADPVDVIMTVTAPATWGKLTGTITGLAVCDQPGAPLKGAVVHVDGSTQDFDLKTDAGGNFAVWMDEANGPLTLTISASGFVGQTRTGVVIMGTKITTENADLRLDAPCGSIAPLSINVALPTNQTMDVPLDLTNTGAAPFDFGAIAETSMALTGSQPPAGLAPTRSHSPVKTGPAALAASGKTAGRPAGPLPKSPAWGLGASVPGGAARYAPAQCDGDPDHFYVFGGVDSTFSTSANAWRYDAVADAWTALAPMPEGFEGSAGACDAGRIHVLGGGGTDAHYIYDIGNDSWSSGAPLPRPVEGAAAAAWDGRVFLIGGDDDFSPGSGVSDRVDIYDVATDTWTAAGASMPTGASNMGYAQVGSTVYLAGGWVGFEGNDTTGGAINTGATQAYDLIGDAWTSGPDLEIPRADLALAATDSAIYALGGDGPGPDFFEATDVAERLPTGSWPGGAWAPIDSLPIGIQGDSAGFCTLESGSPNADIWAVGGIRVTDQFFLIDGLNLGWQTAGEGCPTIRGDVPWLSEDPLAGSVAADGAGQIHVTIDTTGLADGPYHATLFIPTTDPRIGEVRIPVSLVVSSTKILLAVEKDGTVAGVKAKNEDIVAVHTDGTGALWFDGSDVGLSKLAINAFARLDDGSILLSFSASGNVPGISGKVEAADIVQFVPTSLGDTTAGTFSLYFDGSDVGLGKKDDNVDALDVQADGSLLISTAGTAKPVSGIEADDSDVLRFEPSSLGATTAGTWSLYLDMSDVGLTTNDEDLDALAVFNGRVLLSTTGNLSVPGLTAQDDDVVIFDPTSTGATTAGTWNPIPYLDGASIGIDKNDVTAIGLP